jgi:hypothetical protein
LKYSVTTGTKSQAHMKNDTVGLNGLTGTLARHSGFEAARNAKLAPAVCGREFREQD